MKPTRWKSSREIQEVCRAAIAAGRKTVKVGELRRVQQPKRELPYKHKGPMDGVMPGL